MTGESCGFRFFSSWSFLFFCWLLDYFILFHRDTLDYSKSRIGNTMGLFILNKLERDISLLKEQSVNLRRLILDELSGDPKNFKHYIPHSGHLIK